MAVSGERQYQADLKAYARNYPFARGPGRRAVQAKIDREREEARQRAQKFQNRFKEVKKARRERADVARRAQQSQLPQYVDPSGWRRGTPYATATPEERVQEAQATILEVEAAKVEDQKWVVGFTPQQEQEIAGYETAVQRVKSGVISGDIGLEDGGRMVQTLNQKIGSYQEIRRPRRKDEPWYAPGPEGEPRGEGDVWTEGLTTFTREKGVPKLLVRPNQTAEFEQMKTQQALEEKQQQAEGKRALEIEKYIRTLRTEQIETTVKDAEGKESTGKRYRTPAEVYEATLRGYPKLPPSTQAPPPVFGGEPEQVTQAREALKTGWGMGLKARKAAKDTLFAWEKAQEGNKRLTDTEIDKLPPGTAFIGPDGKRRRKP